MLRMTKREQNRAGAHMPRYLQSSFGQISNNRSNHFPNRNVNHLEPSPSRKDQINKIQNEI